MIQVWELVVATMGALFLGFATGIMAEQDRQRKRARHAINHPSTPPCSNCASTRHIPNGWGGWWPCGWCAKARDGANWAYLERLKAADKPAPPTAPPNDYGNRRGPRPEATP